MSHCSCATTHRYELATAVKPQSDIHSSFSNLAAEEIEDYYLIIIAISGSSERALIYRVINNYDGVITLIIIPQLL